MPKTNEDILKQSIEKTLNNGWLPKFYLKKWGKVIKIITKTEKGKSLVKEGHFWLEYENIGSIINYNVYEIIFSIDFAKAFFGEEDIEDSYWDRVKSKYIQRFEWSAHLQQMVLEPEPLLYLKKFLDN